MNIEAIAKATRCPLKNVKQCWPRIEECMTSLGQTSRAVKIAALATVAVETAWKFLPIHEYGSEAYLNKMYDQRTDLGNTPVADGDGARYCGRGFVQITGKANYEHYGKLCGVDLVSSPDKAMDADVAATILAAFFGEHKVAAAAEAGDWTRVRKKINGGTNNLKEFLSVVESLQQLAEGDI